MQIHTIIGNYIYRTKDSSVELPNTVKTKLSNDKIRFEEQREQVKKAFYSSVNDSNRLGLFFSPSGDLYKDLDDLRIYYFERISGKRFMILSILSNTTINNYLLIWKKCCQQVF